MFVIFLFCAHAFWILFSLFCHSGMQRVSICLTSSAITSTCWRKTTLVSDTWIQTSSGYVCISMTQRVCVHLHQLFQLVRVPKSQTERSLSYHATMCVWQSFPIIRSIVQCSSLVNHLCLYEASSFAPTVAHLIKVFPQRLSWYFRVCHGILK